MTPHNITNSANNLKITELVLYNIVEFQAFGSRSLRRGAKKSYKLKFIRLFCIKTIQINAVENIMYFE